jgi:glycosyltransferase involved in cell wall biosynthesis
MPSSGTSRPRLTVITPSYNQGRFIEETIRSVLLQGYPDLEYMVIDGGSTDETLGIIRKYARWLSYWVSEPDRGQAHAINKGLARTTGVAVNWINSDDVLLPNALDAIAGALTSAGDTIVVGDVVNFWDGTPREERIVQRNIALRPLVEYWTGEAAWHQPGIFLPTKLFEVTGPLDEGLQYLFDYDLLCRAVTGATVRYLAHPLVRFRLHPRSKSMQTGHRFVLEAFTVSQRYWSAIPAADVIAYRRKFASLILRVGLRQFRYSPRQALALLQEALRVDLVGALVETVRHAPRWLARRTVVVNQRRA